MKNLTDKEQFSENEINKGKEILNKYTEYVANNNILFKEGYKTTYNSDYSFLSLKRSRLIECLCYNANFNATALTGSNFENTEFKNCSFLNATLDFCLFHNCVLSSNNPEYAINNANLGNSNLVGCILNNISIKKSTASNTLFEDSMFIECSFDYSSFENCIFRNCRFKNMEFRNLNLEFVEFINSDFDNILFPFAQIPYTFGLLTCIQDHPHRISISSKSNDKRISSEEYFELLPEIIPYYLFEQEYFPAANIYILFQEYEKAFETIIKGIRKACFEKNFRMLKYLCKLSITSGWCDRKKILQLYYIINNINNFEPLTDFERHNYYMQLGDFRKILLFGNNLMPTIHFHLQTNIFPHEAEKVATLIDGINKIIDSADNKNIISTIELHHESPYSFVVAIMGAIVTLKIIAEGLHALYTPVKDAQEITINQQQIELNAQEILINQEKLKQMRETGKNVKETIVTQQISIYGDFYVTNFQPDRIEQKRGHIDYRI